MEKASKILKKEESLDQSHESVQNSAKVKSHKKIQNSSGKKKKQRAQSMSDIDEDEDNSDESDYGDEDDELDNNGSFIASEGEVEKELQEQKRREREERRKEKKEQGIVGEKKKRYIEEELDEDDKELINEHNQKIGKNYKKDRRLQRNDQAEKIKEEEVELEVKMQIDEEAEEEEEEEQEQVKDNSYEIRQKERIQNNYEQAKSIFKDPKQLMMEIKEQQRIGKDEEAKRQQQKIADLQDIFDGDEINNQFATKADRRIVEIDIPERLQLKLNQRIDPNVPTMEELKLETDWIFLQFVEEKGRNEFIPKPELVKRRILKLLQFLRIELLDVPFIITYRKYDFSEDLDHDDVWTVLNLDIEYGKVQREKQQIVNVLQQVMQFNPVVEIYLEELNANDKFNLCQLSNFSKLITYLQTFYSEELQKVDEEGSRKMAKRIHSSSIIQGKQKEFHLVIREFLLHPSKLVENLQLGVQKHRPVEQNVQHYSFTINKYMHGDEVIDRFAACELGVEPYLRQLMKKLYYEKGVLSTQPTDKGKKDLDVFHPSYRVKNINQEPIFNFMRGEDSDRYIEIMKCMEDDMISLKIEVPKPEEVNFLQHLETLYLYPDSKSQWNWTRLQVLQLLKLNVLHKEIESEVRDELRQLSENCVIEKCQKRFRELLVVGPFKSSQNAPKPISKEVIPDRERLNVMGVILHQLDSQNQLVTVVVVDKFGEVVSQKNFAHLLPPRKLNEKYLMEEDKEKVKKLKLTHQEETKDHEKDLETMKMLIHRFSVDLIVVGANKLDARRVKMVVTDIASKLKTFGIGENNDDDADRNNEEDEQRKEAFVVWGSLEIPKLFSQDPMSEILNLWSHNTSENQTLQLSMHPFQRFINQAKLQDSLEDIAVQEVNNVGVDLNLVVDHEHMQGLLQFLSGLGPRKAKKLLSNMKQHGSRIQTRGEIFQLHLLTKRVYWSVAGFLKIKIPQNEVTKNTTIDLLDQTRIHQSQYMLATKISSDMIYEEKAVDNMKQYEALQIVIQNPHKLKNLDMDTYKKQLEHSGQSNMAMVLDLIKEELEHPFKDRREYRSPENLKQDLDSLFYMLIDESERTFKKGAIITAQVVRVTDDRVFCKLDNGLDGIINKDDMLGQGSGDKKLKDVIQPGHVLPARIFEILKKEEQKFGVILKCRKEELENHKGYLDEEQKQRIPEEDLQNHNFIIEKKDPKRGKYQPRKINHTKFKNLTSSQAMTELRRSNVGDFLFRPSSKGTNNITLTWYFYMNCFVHVDIREEDKLIGTSIGNRLYIGDSVFEKLEEIVERYILPCNRALKEAKDHPKFVHSSSLQEFEEKLKQEKQENSNTIPYKFTVLEEYPQHIVLGYVPKEKLVKEFIKVKPKGYYFHGEYYNNFQVLINWFKEKCMSKDYMRDVRRARSPRIVPVMNNPLPADILDSMGPDAEMNYGGPDEIRGGMKSESGYGKGEHMSGYREYQQRDSDFNQNQLNRGNQMSDNQRRESRPPMTCFNCQEVGHRASDCTNEKKPRERDGGDRGRGRGGRGGYDGNREESKYPRRNQQSDEGGASSNWDNNHDNASSIQQESASNDAWGAQSQNVEASNSTSNFGNDAKGKSPSQQEVQPSTSWGQATPRQEAQPSDNANSWGAGGGFNSNDNNESSPAREEDGGYRGRGRGRGRGEGRGGDRPGGDRACFKCNEVGHMIRDCPNADQRPQRGRGGGAGGNRSCYKCGEEGHMSRECPNPDSQRGGDRGRGRGGRGGGICYRCNQEGHFARECPNEQDEGAKSYKRQRGDFGSKRRDQSEDNGDNNGGGGNAGWAGGSDQWAVSESNQQMKSEENGNSGWNTGNQG